MTILNMVFAYAKINNNTDRTLIVVFSIFRRVMFTITLR